MKGGYTDNYYMQMAENLRRYDAEEPRRVVGYYQAAAAESMVVLGRAQAGR